MLWDWRTEKEVGSIPPRAERDLREIRHRLSPDELHAMEGTINHWADETGADRTDFFASNWKAPGDWSRIANGVFMPLYEACDEQFERSGWMLGWLIRSVMIERGDEWYMYKNPEAGTPELRRDFWGTFYWRRDRRQ
jgi:hypothetical protein